MESPGDANIEVASPPPDDHAFDVFILHAADDREFVRGYLVPALNLPAQRVLLADDLRPGAVIGTAIDRAVSSSQALITAWPVLRDAITRYRSDEQQRRRLEARVAEWVDRGRGATSLMDPTALSEAEQWMQSSAAQPWDTGWSSGP